MERSGVKMDQYTLSIIMRALKTQHGRDEDVQRAMSFLDHVSFDICSSGVLFSIVLETAVKYREMDRIQSLVQAWEASSMKPCSHTSAALIKAYGLMSNLDRCFELWQQAFQER